METSTKDFALHYPSKEENDQALCFLELTRK